MLAGYMVHFSSETIFQCSESSENLLMLGLLHLVFCIQSTYKSIYVLSSYIPLLDSFLVLQTAVRSPKEFSQSIEDTLNNMSTL